MSRFPQAKKGEATKEFSVAAGVIMGDPQGSGKTLKGGDRVRLTKKQANFLLNMPKRMIDVDLPDFSDDDNGPADHHPPKAGSGDTAEGPGDDADGTVSDAANAQVEGDSSPRRKNTKL